MHDQADSDVFGERPILMLVVRSSLLPKGNKPLGRDVHTIATDRFVRLESQTNWKYINACNLEPFAFAIYLSRRTVPPSH